VTRQRPNDDDGCLRALVMLVLMFFGPAIWELILFLLFFALVMMCGMLSRISGS
jgi:hypothetical protein